MNIANVVPVVVAGVMVRRTCHARIIRTTKSITGKKKKKGGGTASSMGASGVTGAGGFSQEQK